MLMNMELSHPSNLHVLHPNKHKNYAHEVNMRLMEWAHWRSKDRSHLSYPSESITTKLLQGSPASSFHIPENPRAEEIDKLLALLKCMHPDWANIVIAYYDRVLNEKIDNVVKKCGVPRSVFFNILDRAKVWFEAKLN